MSRQILGHYELLEKLGEGGMGVVYKARDTHLDRLVAIKVLPPEKVADPERKRRFVQEAKAASALNHPNIITIHDIASDAGRDFIVMEYVAGRTLDQLIGRKGLKLSEALKYAVQMADALAAAHGAGIIHRDLKPGNVMVTEAGLVKVLDFGLAKLTEPVVREEAPTQTAEGTIVGTVAYMSPEQAKGKPVDVRSDIFSFGSVLYEMVKGRRGNRLTFSRWTLSTHIWRVELPGPDGQLGRPLRLLASTRGDYTARYSPDGKRIAFVSMRSGSPEIWVSDSDGANAFQLTAFGGPYTGTPRWSPDGAQIVFGGHAAGRQDIYVVRAAGGGPRRLTTQAHGGHTPSWSRDGKCIYFVSSRTGQSQVWKIPADGGPETQVTRQGGHAAVESSDGSLLYYAKSGGSPTSLWKVPVNGGEETQVLDSIINYSTFDAAEDGIYYSVGQYGRRGFSIRFLSLPPGRITTLATLEGAPSFGLSVSPDRRFIIFSQYEEAEADLMLVENFR